MFGEYGDKDAFITVLDLISSAQVQSKVPM